MYHATNEDCVRTKLNLIRHFGFLSGWIIRTVFNTMYAPSAVTRICHLNGIMRPSSYLFWIDQSLKIMICLSVHLPSLQMHANTFFGVFWWEHGGADLRVTTAGNLWPVWVPLAFLRHQLWRQVGWMQRFLLKHTFSLIVPFPRRKTKHFKYLPGSDPRHPLQARQICRAISQLQSSCMRWWERNHNSVCRKEKVVVLNPFPFL